MLVAAALISDTTSRAAIPLLKRHLEFILERQRQLEEDGVKPDEFRELLDVEWTLGEMDKIVSRGVGHLTEVRSFNFYALVHV